MLLKSFINKLFQLISAHNSRDNFQLPHEKVQAARSWKSFTKVKSDNPGYFHFESKSYLYQSVGKLQQTKSDLNFKQDSALVEDLCDILEIRNIQNLKIHPHFVREISLPSKPPKVRLVSDGSGHPIFQLQTLIDDHWKPVPINSCHIHITFMIQSLEHGNLPIQDHYSYAKDDYFMSGILFDAPELELEVYDNRVVFAFAKKPGRWGSNFEMIVYSPEDGRAHFCSVES